MPASVEESTSSLYRAWHGKPSQSGISTCIRDIAVVMEDEYGFAYDATDTADIPATPSVTIMDSGRVSGFVGGQVNIGQATFYYHSQEIPQAVSQEDAAPMAVLRHYYDRLAHGVHDPMSLASKLYSLRLLSREERDQVISPPNVTPLCRTMTLLGAVEARIAAAKSAEPLLAFCQALEQIPGLRVIAEDMKKELAVQQLCASEKSSESRASDLFAGKNPLEIAAVTSTNVPPLPQGAPPTIATPPPSNPSAGPSTCTCKDQRPKDVHFASLTPTLLAAEDLRDVKRELGYFARWQDLGLHLGLSPQHLEVIDSDCRGMSTDEKLKRVLLEWLKRNYDTGKHGLPSWSALFNAVDPIDHALALTIKRNHHLS